MSWLVTGGSRGLGAAIVVEGIAQGHDVAFAYRTQGEAARAVEARAKDIRPGCRCQGFELDVRDPDAVEAVLGRVEAEFDPLQVVVNCAGITRDDLVVTMSNEAWKEVIETNLYGPFYVIRQLLPGMLSRRSGRIVNVSSVQHQGGTGQANYAASKAGLHGLTMSIAKEYGRRGITANVVVPGFFDTDMTRNEMSQFQKDYWARHCPMPEGRMGRAEELARVVSFLVGPGASYINGQVIPVTGGLDWST